MYSSYDYSQKSAVGVVTQQQSWTAVPSFDSPAAASQKRNFSNFQTARPNAQNGIPATGVGASAPAQSQDPSALVIQYSLYYQQWSAQGTEARRRAEELPKGSAERDEEDRRASWADYYADQASRSAHYYNAVKQGSPVSSTPPVPPPAPPSIAEQADQKEQTKEEVPAAAPKKEKTRSSAKRPSRWGRRVESKADEIPAGLKRYVERCLNQCKTDEERRLVNKELEKRISEAKSFGKMNSIEWDSIELVPLPVRPPVNSRDCQRSNNVSLSSTTRRSEQPMGNRAVASSNSPAPSVSVSPSVSSWNLKDRKRGADVALAQEKNKPFFANNSPSSDAFSRSPSSSKKSKSLRSSSPSKPSFNSDNYDNGLPANDSYYGSSGGRCYDSSSPKQSPVKAGLRLDKGRNLKEKMKGYDLLLPSNDSYYGKTGGEASSFGGDDFIPLTASKNKKNPQPTKKKPNSVQSLKKSGSNKVSSSSSTPDGFSRASSVLARRANRFAGQGGIADAVSSSGKTIGEAFEDNIERYMGKSVIGGKRHQLDDEDYEQMTVKGTCRVLEKDYLRLTAPPKAELVRPKHILERHLLNLKKLWRVQICCKSEKPEEATSSKKDYNWFCSQFKAIRQDLTVQRITDSFTVDVYETHARIALESGDLNEFNQCQTQLKELYDLLIRNLKEQIDVGQKKGRKCKKTGLENYHEFIAYRIIYYVFLTGNKKYEGGSSDLFKIMLSLSPEQRDHPSISHALKVRVACAEFDYHSFFRLRDNCPDMGSYLMEYLVPIVRHTALQRIQKAYRPSISARYVLEELGFDVEDDLEEGKEWLISCGCKLDESGETFLTKDSAVRESNSTGKTNSLI